MRPTKYNRRITVQKRTKSENEIGGWSNVWKDFYSSWASVTPLSGMKRMEYARLAFTESYEIEMRSRKINVDSDCRIVYGGKDFQIVSIIIEGETVKLDIAK